MNCDKGTLTDIMNEEPISSSSAMLIKILIKRSDPQRLTRTPLRFSREISPRANNSPRIESLLVKKKKCLTLKRALVHFNYTKKNYLNRSIDKYFSSQTKSSQHSPRSKDSTTRKPYQQQRSALTARNSKMLDCIKQCKIDLSPSRYCNLHLKLA